MKHIYLSFFIIFGLFLAHSASSQAKYIAKRTQTAPVINGLATDTCWNGATWYVVDQLWLGAQPTTADFAGRFKVTWDANKLYVLAEITDDSLSDTHPDSLTSYWEDDTFEIFIDENQSGGDHQNTYNAMAYHISKYFDAVDIGTDGNPHTYKHALSVARTRSGNVYTWEAAINVYTDAYDISVTNNPKATLVHDKMLGFAIAYCDNDGGSSRESFMGSEVINASDKNVAYKDASVFGGLQLKSSSPASVADNFASTSSHTFYPNPATDKIYFSKGVTVRLFNHSGAEVLIEKQAGYMDISHLPTGIYFVEMSKNGVVSRKKLLKQF